MLNRLLNASPILLLLLSLTVPGFSQEATPAPTMTRAAQYHLGDRDQILMSVNVWGYVARPGQYVVPRSTDLLSLIAFAGGPVGGANLGRVNIIRAGDLVKEDVAFKAAGTMANSTDKVPILVVDVRRHLKTGEIGKIPILAAGDTILIPETSGSKFSKLLGLNSMVSIITAMASLAIIIERTK